MKILVINCGSSSVKYRFYQVHPDGGAEELAKGLIERIGSEDAEVHHTVGAERHDYNAPIRDADTAIGDIARCLRERGALRGDLAGIGHRVVHGGEAFFESVAITDEVVAQIERCGKLAPLHNPANLAGIRACAKIFPQTTQVAVFDTAFFSTLEPAAYLYALPYEWYENYQVRRYGFHGTSHRYVSERAAELLGKPLGQCNLITMHLGNGCSMAAVRAGRAVNTTMGLTPLEGLVMGTRCGDIDTAIVFHMLRTTDLGIEAVHQALEKKSGLLGVSGVSRDMRDVTEAAGRGVARAKLALDIFVRRVRKYLGAYLTDVGPCDAVVFTGGIGENSHLVRERVIADLGHLGLRLDVEKNRSVKLAPPGVRLSTADSPVAVFAIPTNEELAIARDTYNLVSQSAS